MVNIAAEAILELRTLVVEDHEPFLHYLCSALQREPNIRIVARARDGLEAVARAEALQPDLIILDIGLPCLNGIEAARQIRLLSPGAKIVFLTQESSPEIVHEALSLGAWGCVMKASVAGDLCSALRAVMSGRKLAEKLLHLTECDSRG